jgi:hypothetical protein
MACILLVFARFMSPLSYTNKQKNPSCSAVRELPTSTRGLVSHSADLIRGKYTCYVQQRVRSRGRHEYKCQESLSPFYAFSCTE